MERKSVNVLATVLKIIISVVSILISRHQSSLYRIENEVEGYHDRHNTNKRESTYHYDNTNVEAVKLKWPQQEQMRLIWGVFVLYFVSNV